MDLSDEKLSRTIPQEIGQLKKLTHLSLGENKLTGSIPETIGDLGTLSLSFSLSLSLSPLPPPCSDG
jgi:Leucine-rich repeat (LRR) protein